MKFVEWLNRHVAPWITSLGITPRSVTLEVRGRSSGKPIRVSHSPVDLAGKRYLVSVYGERQWVRNVRAANGNAFILHGRRTAVHLAEVPIEQRAPILLAYVGKRALTRSARQASRLYFGLEAPTLQDMEGMAGRYPVFLIESRGQDGK